MRWIIHVLVFLACAGVLVAQDPEPAVERVEVVVTAVVGAEVTLDRGTDDGIQVGDAVELAPVEGPRVLGRIRSVSRHSARATLRDASAIDRVAVETTGFVAVPRDRMAGRDTEHPPWTHPPVEWDQDVPLLAPIRSQEPEERPRDLRGRIYTGLDWSEDAQADQTYQSAYLGVDVELENPFRRGGVLSVDVQQVGRHVELADEPDDRSSFFRANRLSYRRDVLRGRPTGFEVGRFLPGTFPELGLLDGVEVVHRLSGGSRIGVNAGALPLADDELTSDDDLAFSVFGRWVSDERESLALGGALQKTWHDGAPDRDLFVGTLDARPTETTSLYATTWVDYYTSSDDLKDSGIELTQLQTGATWRIGRHGLGVFGSHQRWPDVESEAIQVPDETVTDGHVTRYGLHGWLAASERTRLSGRYSTWEDESDDGDSGSLRVSVRDLLWSRGDVSLEGFVTGGEFSDSAGLRLGASRQFDVGWLRLTWDRTDYDQEDFVGGQSSLLQQRVRLSFDTALGGNWDLSLYAEDFSGDEQDATAFGFYLQRHFR